MRPPAFCWSAYVDKKGSVSTNNRFEYGCGHRAGSEPRADTVVVRGGVSADLYLLKEHLEGIDYG